MAGTVTLLALGADWRYLAGTAGHSTGFQSPAFDDSGWSEAPAPFGGDLGFCYGLSAATTWPGGSADLCLRASVVVPSGVESVTVSYAVDNEASVYWDGTLIDSQTHPGCASTTGDDYTVVVVSPGAGTHTLAVRAHDTGFSRYFGASVTAPAPTYLHGAVLIATGSVHPWETLWSALGLELTTGAVLVYGSDSPNRVSLGPEGQATFPSMRAWIATATLVDTVAFTDAGEAYAAYLEAVQGSSAYDYTAVVVGADYRPPVRPGVNTTWGDPGSLATYPAANVEGLGFVWIDGTRLAHPA